MIGVVSSLPTMSVRLWLQLLLFGTPALSVTLSYGGQLWIPYEGGYWPVLNFSSEGPMSGLPEMEVSRCYGFSRTMGVEGLPGDHNDNKAHIIDVYKGCCRFYEDKNCKQEIFSASDKWDIQDWRDKDTKKTVGSFICFNDSCPAPG
jgi:hypothetical protein